MDTLEEIIAKRSAPGVLILDLQDRLLYSNREALELLVVLRQDQGEQCVPPEVYELCARLRKRSHGGEPVSGVIRRHNGAGDGDGEGEAHCAIRALVLGEHHNGSGPSHVMVLMEKIIRKRQLDIEKARERFQLSKREGEVLRLVCQGLSNREIADTIFISEFTVKDHIKNIMRKMEAGSRNEMMAALL
jgi:DNA-binding CsgD family transcriptional regulator